MKRDFLVDAGNRITDFHDKGKAFVNYLSNHIAHLVDVRNILDEEIEKYSRIKNVVDAASTNDNKLQEKARAGIPLPKTTDLDDIEVEIDTAIQSGINLDDGSSDSVTQQ